MDCRVVYRQHAHQIGLRRGVRARAQHRVDNSGGVGRAREVKRRAAVGVALARRARVRGEQRTRRARASAPRRHVDWQRAAHASPRRRAAVGREQGVDNWRGHIVRGGGVRGRQAVEWPLTGAAALRQLARVRRCARGHRRRARARFDELEQGEGVRLPAHAAEHTAAGGAPRAADALRGAHVSHARELLEARAHHVAVGGEHLESRRRGRWRRGRRW